MYDWPQEERDRCPDQPSDRQVANMHMRVASVRKDFPHKQTTPIAQNHGTVMVEALKVRGMSASAMGTAASPDRKVKQKAGRNRAVLDKG